MFDGAFSIWHIAIVAVLAVVLFYKGDKLPDAARSIGRSLRVFKTEIKGLTEDDKAREAAQNGADQNGADQNGAAQNGAATSAAEVPTEVRAIEAPATAPRVVAQPSDPIPVQAEIVRDGDLSATRQPGSRPRPRPTAGQTRR